MTQPSTTRPTYLVVESAGADQGRRISLIGNSLTVGRLPTCDVRFSDVHVSRTHAVLWRRGGLDYVEDLGSSGGTFVNNIAITGPRELHHGDTVAFAGLRLRYQGEVPTPQAVRYDIRDQWADELDNAGRDQYDLSQYVIEVRESFFREIAAARTKARRLVWTGLALFAIGLGIAYAGGYSFFELIVDAPLDPSAPSTDFIGSLTAAVGGVTNAVGLLLMIIGTVLHVVATSRRRLVDRELPPPPVQYRGH
ncbi:FHA domain-containing protein [Kribbella sp. VKM Ac-2568]|uniref:FHA domain-containing protein n=1 Tax=Kribbella sp. VKM Ac-2568 TaxID=2512219 RepID=UPI00104F891E|nr:FHA domain-containing protein [Kribbella sp. VKM Ac-2568]TCM50491.1 FHA domain-containing protein [Kribbella sp. VKM Ac-2568]